MSKSVVSVIIIFFLLSSITGAAKEKCKQNDLLERCTIALPVLSSPDISFALTGEELKNSCKELEAGIKCIRNYTEFCMEPGHRVVFQQIYSGITSVIDDLCSKRSFQEEYLKHAECVKGVRMEYESCSKNYESKITSLNSYQRELQYADEQSHEAYLRTICCSIQEYLLCSERTVQRSCGDGAAQFVKGFLKKMSFNIIRAYCQEYKGRECGLPDYDSQGRLLADAGATARPALRLAGLAALSHYYLARLAPA